MRFVKEPTLRPAHFLVVFLLTCFLILGVIAYSHFQSGGESFDVKVDHSAVLIRSEKILRFPVFTEIPYEIFLYGGVETFIRRVEHPKGVLFLFHGCGHDGNDWFVLPEELLIVREALRLKLHIVAFSSQDRGAKGKCWDSQSFSGGEIQLVAGAIHDILYENNWSPLPLYLLGASSGGEFSCLLPERVSKSISFVSQLIYLSPGSIEEFESLVFHPHEDQAPNYKRYPRTAFVSMRQDQRTEKMMGESQASLATRRIKTELFSLEREPLRRTSFSESLGITKEQSTQLYMILLDNNVLDASGFPSRNPNSSDWFQILINNFDDPEFIEEKKLHLQELLNKAFGFHELSSQNIENILYWATHKD